MRNISSGKPSRCILLSKLAQDFIIFFLNRWLRTIERAGQLRSAWILPLPRADIISLLRRPQLTPSLRAEGFETDVHVTVSSCILFQAPHATSPLCAWDEAHQFTSIVFGVLSCSQPFRALNSACFTHWAGHQSCAFPPNWKELTLRSLGVCMEVWSQSLCESYVT